MLTKPNRNYDNNDNENNINCPVLESTHCLKVDHFFPSVVAVVLLSVPFRFLDQAIECMASIGFTIILTSETMELRI